jgi:hypothetical protein
MPMVVIKQKHLLQRSHCEKQSPRKYLTHFGGAFTLQHTTGVLYNLDEKSTQKYVLRKQN